jgi:hypothetical protein
MNSPNTYAMESVQGTITGPGGVVPLGTSAGPTDEGITIAWKGELNTMTFGADGEVQHALHAARPGRITARYLKTSPTNAALQTLFNFQQGNPANWGQNVIEFIDVNRGDTVTLSQGAFAKPADITYDKEGRFNEWIFDGVLSIVLGAGLANVNTPTGV